MDYMIYGHAINDGCPLCADGHVVLRDGKHGEFHGCSTFPKCRWNESAVDYRAPRGSEGDWSIMFNPQETHDYPAEEEMIREF